MGWLGRRFTDLLDWNVDFRGGGVGCGEDLDVGGTGEGDCCRLLCAEF